MASGWGSFLTGLSHTTQQLPALIQRQQALTLEAEKMKQLEDAKTAELHEKRFAHGITLMNAFKGFPEMQSQIYQTYIKPAGQYAKGKGAIQSDFPDITPDMFTNKNLTEGIKELGTFVDAYTKTEQAAKKEGSNIQNIPKQMFFGQIDNIVRKITTKLTDESDIKKFTELGKETKANAATQLYQGASSEDKPFIGAQMTAPQQKAMGVGMGPKSAPQRSFTGPGGKTMRVNQVFDESTGTYNDVGEPWEYKDPAAVVKVVQDAKGAQGEMTDDAITIAAQQYIRTGQMPALGMGNAQIRVKVLNKAGELVKASGVDPSSVPAIAAEFKATQGALNKMERDYAGFAAFEQGMLKNMDYALSISKKYGNTPLPPANAIINALRTKTGDPKIVEYANAVYAAAMEYEKIRTAGTAVTSAELSVQAQKKAEELINTSQTHGQLMGAAKAMKTDARNIIGARKGEMERLKKELKASPYAPKAGKSAKEMSDDELLRELSK